MAGTILSALGVLRRATLAIGAVLVFSPVADAQVQPPCRTTIVNGVCQDDLWRVRPIPEEMPIQQPRPDVRPPVQASPANP